jgi:phosphohistidine phosphatase SixA
MTWLRPLTACLALLAVSACGDRFDRSELLQAAQEDELDALRQADRHILVVRHARKIDEACNGLECELSARGNAMVDRLGVLLGPRPMDAVLASSACRTVLTARAGHADVVQHQPAPGLDQACGSDEPVTRSRAIAMLETEESRARWTLVVEHSNTVCTWIAAFAPDARSACEEGSLPSSAYGDIFWLHRLDGDWHLVTLDDAFDVEASQ